MSSIVFFCHRRPTCFRHLWKEMVRFSHPKAPLIFSPVRLLSPITRRDFSTSGPPPPLPLSVHRHPSSDDDFHQFIVSVNYLLNHSHYSEAISLFTSRPDLHTLDFTLHFLNSLPISSPSLLSLLSHLSSLALLPYPTLSTIFYHSCLSASLPVAYHTYHLLSSLFPSPFSRPALSALSLLLQSHLTHRLHDETRQGLTAIHLHPPLSHLSLPLNTLTDQLEKQKEPIDKQQIAYPPWKDQEEGFTHPTLPPLDHCEVKLDDWPALLQSYYEKAIEYRQSNPPTTPFRFLSVVPPPSSSLSDACIIAELMHLLTLLTTQPEPFRLRRSIVPVLQMLIFHLSFLSSLSPSRPVDLIEAQLALIPLLSSYSTFPSLLTSNLLLHSWACLLSPSFPPPPPHLSYSHFLSFYSSTFSSLPPSPDTFEALMRAGQGQSHDWRRVEWVRKLLEGKESKAAMASPGLLGMAQPLKSLQIIREERDRRMKWWGRRAEEEVQGANPPPFPLTFSAHYEMQFQHAASQRDLRAVYSLWSQVLAESGRPPPPLPSAFFLALCECKPSVGELIETFHFLTSSSHSSAFPLIPHVLSSLLFAFLQLTSSSPPLLHAEHLHRLRTTAFLLLERPVEERVMEWVEEVRGAVGKTERDKLLKDEGEGMLRMKADEFPVWAKAGLPWPSFPVVPYKSKK